LKSPAQSIDGPSPAQCIRNIALGADGIWRPPGHSAVSYPDEGHDSCHGVEDGSFWFRHRNRCIAALVGNFQPPPALPFADIGGGNGFVSQMLSGLGLRTVLIEPGESGIRHARERGLAELVQASIVDLDVIPASLGAIGLFDVVEHIEQDADALRSLRPMLADGGRIYATVPAHAWLWSSVDVDAGHFRRYTSGQLRRLFESAGFTVDFCSYYFWPLPPAMWLMRTLPERLGARARPQRQARVKSEHGHESRWLQRSLAWEESMLRNGRRVPFGASLILAASRHGIR
jgi:SAM-dependent methyltransferase